MLAVAALVAVAAGIFGVPVAKSLCACGFEDPSSESAKAKELLTDKFDKGDVQMVIVVSAPDGADGGAARAVGTELVDDLMRSPRVVSVTSLWTAPAPERAALVSSDGRSGLIVAGIAGNENKTQEYAKDLSDRLVHDRAGVTVRAGGEAMVNVEITEQSQRDLLLMESLAVPISFLVLVWVFGGALAAAVPLAVGGIAILGALAVLRGVTYFTHVSIFALNLSAAMGLALAIDYTLLIVSRYRDELADGASRDDALVQTMATAGRTVLFSATIVALSMAVMAVFRWRSSSRSLTREWPPSRSPRWPHCSSHPRLWCYSEIGCRRGTFADCSAATTACTESLSSRSSIAGRRWSCGALSPLGLPSSRCSCCSVPRSSG